MCTEHKKSHPTTFLAVLISLGAGARSLAEAYLQTNPLSTAISPRREGSSFGFSRKATKTAAESDSSGGSWRLGIEITLWGHSSSGDGRKTQGRRAGLPQRETELLRCSQSLPHSPQLFRPTPTPDNPTSIPSLPPTPPVRPTYRIKTTQVE